MKVHCKNSLTEGKGGDKGRGGKEIHREADLPSLGKATAHSQIMFPAQKSTESPARKYVSSSDQHRCFEDLNCSTEYFDKSTGCPANENQNACHLRDEAAISFSSLSNKSNSGEVAH